jgi:orotidine-5'-phosphate decarboxylase
MADPRERLIVALDVDTAAAARKIVAAVGESASLYKVGKQLFTAEGPDVVRDLVSAGRRVFLDLKFHDIPNTVAAAARNAGEMGAALFTVHASGGSRMMKAAVEAASGCEARPMVVAVTVLTSLTDSDLLEIGVNGDMQTQVLRLANLARNARCGGVVTSAHEAGAVRRALGAGFAIVTPGVRPAGSAAQDQARVVTPAEAIRAGASHIVVGRPITGAADPAKAAESVVEEIRQAQSADTALSA